MAQPFLLGIYYALRRFFLYSPYGNPRQSLRELKWFIQRGRRGWANCDVWSLDTYLSGWLPSALRHLKETKHGVPIGCVDSGDRDGCGNSSEAGMKRAEARWNAILDTMIAGFEAAQRIQDGIYEKELGPYPLERPSYLSITEWKATITARFRKSQELTKRDEEIFKQGLENFTKYYHNLWD